ncbi:MAG: hypothetical protein II905_02785, partial [Muribaculaceae bacterium]|nr:hypothetical protein [Muribaculaceae bacterium]
ASPRRWYCESGRVGNRPLREVMSAMMSPLVFLCPPGAAGAAGRAGVTGRAGGGVDNATYRTARITRQPGEQQDRRSGGWAGWNGCSAVLSCFILEVALTTPLW